MSEQPTESLLDSQDGLTAMSAYLFRQSTLLGQARNKIVEAEKRSPTILSCVCILILACEETAQSVLQLAQIKRARDCFALSRVILETAINVCFIISEGERAAQKAVRHSLQKSYRDLNRDIKLNETVMKLSWTGNIDLDKDPKLKAAVDEFTNKSGKEVREWTAEDIRKRAEVIGKKYGRTIDLHFVAAFALVFRHASEVIHGTLFGALYVAGKTDPAGSRAKRSSSDVLRHHVNSLLFANAYVLEAVILVLATEAQYVKAIANDAEDCTNELRKLMRS